MSNKKFADRLTNKDFICKILLKREFSIKIHQGRDVIIFSQKYFILFESIGKKIVCLTIYLLKLEQVPGGARILPAGAIS